MIRRFSAVYYNGERPVPLNGSVAARKNFIVFRLDDSGEEIAFKWKDVAGFRKDGERTVLSLLMPGIKSPLAHREIVCRDPAFYSFLKPLFDLRTKNFFRRHLRKITVVFSIVSISVLFFMRGFLSHAYLLVPPEADVQIGSNILSSVKTFYKEYKNDKQQKRLNVIISKLKPPDSKYSYSVYIIDDPMVNAMAAPGGSIIVFRGLLGAEYDDGEIAGVLAHEISHVELRHGLRQMIRYLGLSFAVHIAGAAGADQIQTLGAVSDISSLFVIFKYSREYETEADFGAVRLLKKSPYDPKGLQRFLSAMDESKINMPEYLSTHPETKKRIDNIKKQVSAK